MEANNLNDMIKGWFVGNFEPTVYKTGDVEVAVKHYKAGDQEVRHYHKIAKEITVIIKGETKINGVVYKEGAIVVIAPNESADFLAVTDVITTVVKIPGASNDKYEVTKS
jgi:hypothetical protein